MKKIQITFDCPDEETYLQVLGISKSFKEKLSGFAEVNIKEDISTISDEWVIEFGNHLGCKVSVTTNQITVLNACNGWGDGIPIEQIKIFRPNDTTPEKINLP